jgi:prostatic aicd phosphatase
MSLIGVVLIARHGDREGYYQSPSRCVRLSPSFRRTDRARSYEASDTRITPLGSVQTYRSGLGIRQRYLNDNAAFSGLTVEQVDFKAEYVPGEPRKSAGADVWHSAAEGQVIVDSTNSFAQGLFPANAAGETITLANGTNVTSPLGGYVYVPIE